jgi:hypothetical protein
MAQDNVDPINDPKLTPYQRALFLEINNKPDLVHFFKVIFGDYPQIILAEEKFNKAATRRKKEKGVQLTLLRLKMEAYIEEKLARLAGIDIDKLKKQFEEIKNNVEVGSTLEVTEERENGKES